MGEKDPTRFPLLSMFKLESDLDFDSELDSDFPVIDDWISPDKANLRLEEDDERGEGLIEIKLSECFNGCYNNIIKQN